MQVSILSNYFGNLKFPEYIMYGQITYIIKIKKDIYIYMNFI